MPTPNPPAVIPPWFRCAVCNRNKEGHDRAERKLPRYLQHDWETAQKYRSKAEHQQHQPALPTTDEGNTP